MREASRWTLLILGPVVVGFLASGEGLDHRTNREVTGEGSEGLEYPTDQPLENSRAIGQVELPADGDIITNVPTEFVDEPEEPSTRSTLVFSPPQDDGEASSNVTEGFRPSVHLGEIEDPSTVDENTNPFNQPRHLEFAGTLGSSHPRQNSETIKFQDDRAAFHVPVDFLEPTPRPGHVSFEENSQGIATNFEHPREQVGIHPSLDFHGSTNFLDSPAASVSLHQGHPEGPGPSVLQEPVFQTGNAPLVYLAEQQSSFTRTRKFPYQFYQPHFGYGDGEILGEQHHHLVHYPVARRISPWKKIIHLIGAFLPLGLLLAALTPNVVQVDNSTQPNIVLSKLRVVDLPAEHKRARHVDYPGVACEDRVICQMILAGGQSKSNILQNILWELVSRTPDETAKKNGLLEIFQAVKKKNCTLVDCPH